MEENQRYETPELLTGSRMPQCAEAASSQRENEDNTKTEARDSEKAMRRLSKLSSFARGHVTAL